MLRCLRRLWRGFLVASLLGPSLVLAGLLAPSVAAAQIVGVETAVAGFVGQAERGPLDQPTRVTSYGAFLSAFGDDTAGLANPHLAPSVEAFFTNGGSVLWVVRTAGGDDASLIGLPAAGGQPASGLQALSAIDEIALVAVPGATSPAVHVAMLAQCESLADRVCLLDPASRDDVGAVLLERAGLTAPDGFGALYYPWVEASPAGVPVELPPSGFVAGIIARNDTTRGVWQSPAGTSAGLLGATGLTDVLTSSEQDQLNPQGVNALRVIPGAGLLVFGARTLSADPEWRFLSVRRFSMYIEESIDEGTEFVVFEPNDPPLWSQLEGEVEAFLQSLYLQGALVGSTPEEAYFVRCDASTMTQADLDAGRTIIQVGIAALRPAEFVVFRVVQTRAPPPVVPGLAPLGAAALLLLGSLLVVGGTAARRLSPASAPASR